MAAKMGLDILEAARQVLQPLRLRLRHAEHQVVHPLLAARDAVLHARKDGVLGQTRKPMLKKELEFEFAFVKAGGLLMSGADPTGNGGALAGFADQRNIELLEEAGFTCSQAVQIATANGAKFLGELDRIGTIAAGKQADL